MKIISTTFFLIVCLSFLEAQPEIETTIDRTEEYILNPSFENLAPGTIRKRFKYFGNVDSWQDCGVGLFQHESPPEVMRNDRRNWEVVHQATDGNYYAALVTRENDTYESIGQKLQTPLKKDSCYSFKIDICTSAEFQSGTTSIDGVRNPTFEHYNSPVVFNTYISNNTCHIGQLISGDLAITNTEWEDYLIEFKAEEEYSHITFAVFWMPPNFELTNGNILLDNIREFKMVGCAND